MDPGSGEKAGKSGRQLKTMRNVMNGQLRPVKTCQDLSGAINKIGYLVTLKRNNETMSYNSLHNLNIWRNDHETKKNT